MRWFTSDDTYLYELLKYSDISFDNLLCKETYEFNKKAQKSYRRWSLIASYKEKETLSKWEFENNKQLKTGKRLKSIDEIYDLLIPYETIKSDG